MKVVVSLGNSALSDPAMHQSSGELFRGIHNAALSVHSLLDAGHNVVVTFGHEHALDDDPQLSLHSEVTGASSFDKQEVQRQGLIGYLLEQALRSTSNSKRHFATLLTHVLVDGNDPAFAVSADPAEGVCIGPSVDEATAQRWENKKRWTVRSCNDSYRRVVPSPSPICILQTEAIRQLTGAGIFTVLCSGSGVAVKRDLQRRESGVEALVDKDKSAAVLARDIGADALLLLTDVLGVYEHWGTPDRALLPTLRVADIDYTSLSDTGMRPKVEAASWFTRHGEIAAIGPVGSALDVLDGLCGTRLLG